jgi:hypothetical protein
VKNKSPMKIEKINRKSNQKVSFLYDNFSDYCKAIKYIPNDDIKLGFTMARLTCSKKFGGYYANNN